MLFKKDVDIKDIFSCIHNFITLPYYLDLTFGCIKSIDVLLVANELGLNITEIFRNIIKML